MESTCFLTKGGRYYPVHRNKSIVNIYFINSKTANFSSFNLQILSLPFSALLCPVLWETAFHKLHLLKSLFHWFWLGQATGELIVGGKRQQSNFFPLPFPCQTEVCAVVAPFEVCISYSYNLCWCLVTPCLFPPRPRDGKNLPLLLVPRCITITYWFS